MPIFNQSQTLFIHIPKTGGTSIEKQLYELEDPADRYSIQSYFSTDINSQKLRNYSLQHYTFKDFILIMGEDKIKTYHKIVCVVRNPFDRMVSEYYYYSNVIKKVSLDEFTVDELKVKFEKFCKMCFAGHVYNDNHHAPQYKFIVNQGGKIDPRIQILKFESLGTDFESIFNCPLKYHELRSNRKLACQEYYTSTSQKLVADYYHSDFSLFGYDHKVVPNEL